MKQKIKFVEKVKRNTTKFIHLIFIRVITRCSKLQFQTLQKIIIKKRHLLGNTITNDGTIKKNYRKQ